MMPSEVYLKRVGERVTREIDSQGIRPTELARDIKISLGYGYDTAYNFVCHARKAGLMMRQGEKEKRLAILLHALGVSEDDAIIQESREEFGHAFVYPPSSNGHKMTNVQLNQDEKEVYSGLLEEKLGLISSICSTPETRVVMEGMLEKLNSGKN